MGPVLPPSPIATSPTSPPFYWGWVLCKLCVFIVAEEYVLFELKEIFLGFLKEFKERNIEVEVGVSVYNLSFSHHRN